MKVTFYLEVQDGQKFNWVNHTITKENEISWLLENVRKTIESALKEGIINNPFKEVEDKIKPNIKRF
mgnify:CR=1 FL=1